MLCLIYWLTMIVGRCECRACIYSQATNCIQEPEIGLNLIIIDVSCRLVTKNKNCACFAFGSSCKKVVAKMCLGLFALFNIAYSAIWQHFPCKYCNVNALTIYCATLSFLAFFKAQNQTSTDSCFSNMRIYCFYCIYGRQLNISPSMARQNKIFEYVSLGSKTL